MDTIYFTTHKGKQILVEDFTNLKPGPDFHDRLKKAQGIITSQPPKSVLAMFDASGSVYNAEFLSSLKEFTRGNTPYIKAAAVVGITGLLNIALTSIARFTGREFISFKTRPEAMDWLARQ